MIDLETLKALFDDDALVRKYIDRFMEDMPGLLDKMRVTCEARQWDELSIHAHSYKSQMQYINAYDAAGRAYELETICSAPNPESEQMNILIQQLEDHLERILRELKQINE